METIRTAPAHADEHLDVFKFGRNDAVTAGEDIWMASQAMTFQTVAQSIYISSTDETNDVDIEITIEYIDINGVSRLVTAQLHDTDARTFVDTGVDGIHINRAYLSGDGESLTGDVYISFDNTDAGGDGIPDTVAKIGAYIPKEDGQTMQAIYYVPSRIVRGLYDRNIDGLWMEGLFIQANGNTSNSTAVVRLKQLPNGGSERTVMSAGIVPSGPFDQDLRKARWFPAKTIVWIDVLSTTNINDISAHFYGELEPAD